MRPHCAIPPYDLEDTEKVVSSPGLHSYRKMKLVLYELSTAIGALSMEFANLPFPSTGRALLVHLTA